MIPTNTDAATAAIAGLLFESSSLTAEACLAKSHRIMSLVQAFGRGPAEEVKMDSASLAQPSEGKTPSLTPFSPRYLSIARRVFDGEIVLRMASHDCAQVDNLTDDEVAAVKEACRKSGIRVGGLDL